MLHYKVGKLDEHAVQFTYSAVQRSSEQEYAALQRMYICSI